MPEFTDLRSLLPSLHYPPDVVAEKARAIHAALLRESRHVTEGNFTSITNADLARLFDLYDAAFFHGALRQTLQATGHPLTFRLSRRLTRSGGKTYRYRPHGLLAAGSKPVMHYEIAISTTLLYQTFGDVTREVRVNGLVCADRLEALQRILEHEILHLVELLVWDQSSCTAAQFKTLAWRIFAHADVTHDLVTQDERALTNFAIKVGDRVAFVFEGNRHEGVVNRITRRATVLVENANGQPYSNGKQYQKFYIPLSLLEKV